MKSHGVSRHADGIRREDTPKLRLQCSAVRFLTLVRKGPVRPPARYTRPTSRMKCALKGPNRLTPGVSS